MEKAELHNLVDGYLKDFAAWDYSQRRKHSEEWFWAWEEVDHMIREPAPDVMELILGLVDAARENQEALCYIGAGPLEDLINWHPEKFVDQVEEAARQSPSFRDALGCVWFADAVPAPVRVRLARFMP